MKQRGLIATLASAAGLIAASSLGAAAASGQRSRALRQGSRPGQSIRLLYPALRRRAPGVASEAERRRHDDLRQQLRRPRCRDGNTPWRSASTFAGGHAVPDRGRLRSGDRRARSAQLRYRLRRRRDRRPRQEREVDAGVDPRRRPDLGPRVGRGAVRGCEVRLRRQALSARPGGSQDCLPLVSDDDIKAEISRHE